MKTQTNIEALRYMQGLSLAELKKLIRYHRGLMNEIKLNKEAFWECQQELGRRELIQSGLLPRNSLVRIKPEFWDGPEDDCEFVTRGDSSRGRVDITAAQDIGLPIPPVETVEVAMLCRF
jgi:hypothetical protein